MLSVYVYLCLYVIFIVKNFWEIFYLYLIHFILTFLHKTDFKGFCSLQMQIAQKKLTYDIWYICTISYQHMIYGISVPTYDILCIIGLLLNVYWKKYV